eukprot:m.76957 g.76957  ORF g.76957 m.76957 type:complete len:595 (+) comp8529_c0_seq3:89-1873(+)
MKSIHDVLRVLDAPLVEEQLWALTKLVTEALVEKILTPSFTDIGHVGDWKFVICLDSVFISSDGNISMNMEKINSGIDVTAFLADEIKEGMNSVSIEKVHVFSLGALLYTSADFSLSDDEDPSLSEDMEDLITQMTMEKAEERIDLEHIIQLVDKGRNEEDGTPQNVLADLMALVLSIENAGGEFPESILLPNTTTGNLPHTINSSQPPSTNLHANLMAELSSSHDLKDSKARELTGPAPYETPHEILLKDIRKSSMCDLVHVLSDEDDGDSIDNTSTMKIEGKNGCGVNNSHNNNIAIDNYSSKFNSSTSKSSTSLSNGVKKHLAFDLKGGSLTTSRKGEDGANGKKAHRRLTLDTSLIGSILGGLDATTQVRLAFAEKEIAEQHERDIEQKRTKEELGDTSKTTKASVEAYRVDDENESTKDGVAPSKGHEKIKRIDGDKHGIVEATSTSTPQSSTIMSDSHNPVMAVEDESVSFMKLEDHQHINTTLFMVEMDDLQDRDEQLHELVAKQRLCAICHKTKFNLLSRGKPCPLCSRCVCKNCRSDMLVPMNLLGSPQSSPQKGLSPHKTSHSPGLATIMLCSVCRRQIGGVKA